MTIKLCVTTGEMLVAQALYAGIREPFIREKVLKDYPDLMKPSIKTP